MSIRLEDYIVDVIDFPKKGIVFKDIVPLLENPEAFKIAIKKMADAYRNVKIDKVLCADARGFIFGSCIALELGVGLALARKPGKLSRPGKSFSYDLEYGSNTLVLSEGSLKKNERVLIVDDLLATGGSATAMAEIALMEETKIVGFSFLIELVDLKGTAALKKYGPVDSVIKY